MFSLLALNAAKLLWSNTVHWTVPLDLCSETDSAVNLAGCIALALLVINIRFVKFALFWDGIQKRWVLQAAAAVALITGIATEGPGTILSPEQLRICTCRLAPCVTHPFNPVTSQASVQPSPAAHAWHMQRCLVRWERCPISTGIGDIGLVRIEALASRFRMLVSTTPSCLKALSERFKIYEAPVSDAWIKSFWLSGKEA